MQAIDLTWTAEDNRCFATRFWMPPNEQCSTWWLEAESPTQAEVWVNGHAVGTLGNDNPTLEITQAIAMGENALTVRLMGAAEWQALRVVPYACA